MVGVRHGNAPIMNQHAGPRWHKKQPYRTIVVIGGDVSMPPVCFFTTAIRALRGDPLERVLFFVDSHARPLVDSVINVLETWTYPIPPNAPSNPLAEVRLLNSSDNTLLHGVLAAAHRVVWGHTRLQIPTKLHHHKRFDSIGSRAYEVVWTWCSSARRSDEKSCEPLAREVTDFEVQARARGSSSRKDGGMPAASTDLSKSGLGGEACTSLMAVRSTWTGGRWHSTRRLSSPHTERAMKTFQRGEWALENACIGYSRKGAKISKGSERWNVLAQAHGGTSELLWPLPWPDLYLEYTPGYQRLDSETSDHWLTNLVNMSDSPLSRCVWHNATAFLTMMSMDNLYHALIHAVPTREFYERIRPQLSGQDVHVLPHFVQYWMPNMSKTVGWQILVRSLGVNASEWPRVAERAQLLTQQGRCNCYRHLYSGHAAYMPPPFMPLVGSHMESFRNALSASVGVQPVVRRILFQLRRGKSRRIANEAELRAGIASDPLLHDVVHFEIMEALPVMRQYELVSTSPALAGVHGMGLAWTALLAPYGQGGSSCLEITGVWSGFARSDYYSMSVANGVHFIRLKQPNAPECGPLCTQGRFCNYRTCGNVTVNIADVAAKLKLMVSRMDKAGHR